MNTVAEYTLTIRIVQTAESKMKQCQVLNEQGELLVETGRFSHEADAVYAALHSTAVLNNFTGCLQ